jgi:hypothetical protein
MVSKPNMPTLDLAVGCAVNAFFTGMRKIKILSGDVSADNSVAFHSKLSCRSQFLYVGSEPS